ncbi:MAG: hypothetical protein FWH06_04110 [Oscillospiraceae bacterium]|nr:hypothetical protein [Oscillospiraceae bacterium]
MEGTVRITSKTVEVEGRTFQIRKYSAITGLKIAKMLIAKILPVFQSAFPIISKVMSEDSLNDENVPTEFFGEISKALDLVSPDDLACIVRDSLTNCYEVLPAGAAQVMNANGTYGVQNVEHDVIIALRLVCETVLLGCGDFFDVRRLTSVMSPLFSSLPQSLQITTPTSSLR